MALVPAPILKESDDGSITVHCAIGVILSVSSFVGVLATEDTWEDQSFMRRYGGSVVRLLLGGVLLAIGLALADWQIARLLLVS